MSTLQKTQFTMTFNRAVQDTAYFYTWDEDEDLSGLEAVKELQIETAIYEDMGRPEIITVTIEPGDKLNNE